MPYLFITSTPAAEDSVQVNTVASDYRRTAAEVTGAMVRAGAGSCSIWPAPKKAR